MASLEIFPTPRALGYVPATMRPEEESPWRHPRALWALFPLCVLLLAVGLAAPWRSNYGVDSLTFFEQIRAVAQGGSVGFDNGPVHDFHELCPRWIVPSEGRAWGILPAPISYVLAPTMRLGGFRGALVAMWALLALAAVMTYGTVFRLTRRADVAVGSAWALACATSLPSWGTHLAPFLPVAAFGATALYLSQRGFDARTTLRALAIGTATGLFAGLALGTHLLFAIPWGLVGLVTVTAGTLAQRAARAAGYGLGSAPSIALMSWVNHHRFGTWNPVSYGPCDSNGCSDQVTHNQTASAFLDAAKPALPWVAAFGAGLWLARRSPRAAAAVGVIGACGATIPDTATHALLARYARAMFGYVVNFGALSVPTYTRGSDDVGTMLEGFCVRTALQCSPWIALCLLAGEWETHPRPWSHEAARDRATRRTAWAMVLGVLAACALRADTGSFDVWGYPILNIRYVTPAIAPAAVLAAVAAARLPWSYAHLAVAWVFAFWFGARIAAFDDDADLWRRQWTHFFPLALAAVSVGLTSRADALTARGRVAGWLAAMAVAVSVAYGVVVTVVIDRQFTAHFRAPQDERAAELARCTRSHPRYLLLGGYALDESLTAHVDHEILFINVGMGPRNGRNARALVDRFEAPDRPAFLLNDRPDGPWDFDWEGFAFDPVPGCPRMRRVVRRSVDTPVDPK